MRTDSVRAHAHAKLNLALRVLQREASGFHRIDTLFCMLDLADDIDITLTDSGVTLDVSADDASQTDPADLGPVDANLAVRAARALFDRVQHSGGVHIRLAKRIPAGAGLGGGSSDAAAVLTSLNPLLPNPLARADLLSLGARLGSDVPFFIAGGPLAIGRGRGERLEALPPLPRAAVLLAVPPERLSTAEAYAALAASRSGSTLRQVQALTTAETWDDVRALAHNDFEEIVFGRYPRLGAVRETIEHAGALIARLTGTGSVVFGIFRDDDTATLAAQRVGSEHADVATVLTHTGLIE